MTGDGWGGTVGVELSAPDYACSVTLKGSCNEGLVSVRGASERPLVHEDTNIINGLTNPLILIDY